MQQAAYYPPAQQQPMFAPPGQQMYHAVPQQQYMAPTPVIDLTQHSGVIVHQVTQLLDVIAEAVGGCWEVKNKYKVLPVLPGKNFARDHGPGEYKPTADEMNALPEMFRMQEESDCFLRSLMTCVGCLNLRPMLIHFSKAPPPGAPVIDGFTIQRPCRLGGGCCCPLEMNLHGPQPGPQQLGPLLGKVEENCSPCSYTGCEFCWCCIVNHKVLVANPPGSGTLHHKYNLRGGLCCYGRVNNCCGATCCRENLIIDVKDTNGKLVSTITKTFGANEGDCCGAFCRSCFHLSNYVVEFPPDATNEERALLITGAMNIGFAYFERTGDDNNN